MNNVGKIREMIFLEEWEEYTLVYWFVWYKQHLWFNSIIFPTIKLLSFMKLWMEIYSRRRDRCKYLLEYLTRQDGFSPQM